MFGSLIGKKNFIKFNKIHFNKKKKFNLKNELLIEFNAFQPFHVLGSLIANYISTYYSLKIVAFFNYSLVVSPLKRSFFDKLRWVFGSLLNLRTFEIYRSFGVSNFLRPVIIKKYNKKVEAASKVFFDNIKNKNDITSVKINNILIGDLINDSYIKYFKTYTVPFGTKKFHDYLNDFLYLFFYWLNYLNKNRVKCVIAAHTVYSYGLLPRIAIAKKIKVIAIINGQIFRLDKKRKFAHCEYLDFKKQFRLFSNGQKKKALKLARLSLNNRLDGKLGKKIHDIVFSKSSFTNKNKKKSLILKKNNKIKVLIAAHEVHDAPNPMGKNFFSDFYKWMVFLMNISKNTNYDWYLKNHPFQKKMKLFNNQKLTVSVTNMLLKKYTNIHHINSEVSHHQIIKEGIDFVLTVRGTIALEYAYKKIPVLIATKRNFTKPYNFNYYFENKDSYKKTLLNLKKFKHSIINKKEIEEYYFMRYIFSNPDYFFMYYSEYRHDNNNYDQYFTDKFYSFYLEKYNQDNLMLDKMKKNFFNFLKSNDYIMNNKHNQETLKKIYGL